MSTTAHLEVATDYASTSKASGVVFRIQQGTVNRGADISWFSQYPHEQEILFAPLSSLEVRSHRIDGNLVLLEMEISINLTSLTIEAVIHKRKKLLRDLCEQIQGCFSTELATALHWRTQREGWRALGFAVGAVDDARLVDLLKVGLEHVARHEDAYYNDDAQLGEAIRAAVFTKSGLLITAALAQPTVLQGAEKLPSR